LKGLRHPRKKGRNVKETKTKMKNENSGRRMDRPKSAVGVIRE